MSSSPAADGDEVADLTASINRMCFQLKGMRQTIEQSERARLLAQLAAGLAHQLRNSLTGARMSVQLHARRYPAPPATRHSPSRCGSSRSPRSKSRDCLSAGRVERGPTEVATCTSSWPMSRGLVDPACQHARVVLFARYRATTGADPRLSSTDQACARRS